MAQVSKDVLDQVGAGIARVTGNTITWGTYNEGGSPHGYADGSFISTVRVQALDDDDPKMIIDYGSHPTLISAYINDGMDVTETAARLAVAHNNIYGGVTADA